MSQMLYTKYRPKTLKEVQNQDEVVSVLLSSIENKTPASAYIFTGGRGTGKTSIARAFARDLQINEADIFELDAASNSKIEDIRNLIDSVSSLPFYSKYKMYILDEVHMLSKNAANAFLKLLEEPPAHVIFILATTDPQKLPETILSRCIQFNLKKPTLVQIENYLKQVGESENVNLEKDILNALAILGDGSYRDSLSHLQKVLQIPNIKDLNSKEIFKFLNISNTQSVLALLKALDTKEAVDVKEALSILENVEQNGLDVKYLLNTLLSFSRTLLMLRLGAKKLEEVKNVEGDMVANTFTSMLNNKSSKFNSQTLKEIVLLSESKNTTSLLLGLELLFI